MHLAVVGTGSAALVAGACLADFGNDVRCVGLDRAQVSALQREEVPWREPSLETLIKSNVAAGRLWFTGDLTDALRSAEVVFVGLDLPPQHGGSVDLAPLHEVADAFAKELSSYKVLLLCSTVPVGTADRLAARVGAVSESPFGVVSGPLFLKEGDMVRDFMHPDRVIIGTEDARARETIRRLYAPMLRTGDRLHLMDARSAELTKLAASGLLASRISFMNELARLAEELGADIEDVRRAMGADPRIGPQYLFVGPGYGGARFHGDIANLLHAGVEMGRELRVVRASHEVNLRQREVLWQKVRRGLQPPLEDAVVGIWGLAFKPHTGDITEAPSIALVDHALDAGATVQVHDPQALDAVRARYGDRVSYAETMYDAAKGADALVLVTEWRSYQQPDFRRIRAAMRGDLLVDGRNVWEPAEIERHGLRYIGLGR